MKKLTLFVLLAVAIAAIAVTGCKTTTSIVPHASIPLNRASYTILGDTTGEASLTLFLSIFPLGNNQEFGQIGGTSLYSYGYTERVKQNALYRALKQMPEADAVLDPRYEVSVESTLITTTYKVKVTATGIKYQEGLVSK